MITVPVLNNAADVICGSAFVACDGSLVSVNGVGEKPPPGQVRRAVPIGKGRRKVAA